MIQPEEFNKKWDVSKDGPLIKFNDEDLIKLNVSDEVKRFLAIGGLPESSPPYLEFSSSQSIRPISNVLNMREEFEKYLFLGSTSYGDPICIIEQDEKIVFLNSSYHYEEVFINSSLNQFAECLLLFSKMIEKAIEVNGEDAFIDNDIPESVINWITEEFTRIDPKCLEKDSFWFVEFENLTN